MQPPMFITGLTINQTVGRAITSIMRMGKEIETRNGTAKFLNDVTLEIQNPRERHLSLTGRKSNIFQLMAESFWVMAGQDQVTGFLEFYLPRATDYSDDGAHWHGAYGPRIYDHGQMDDLIETFRSEGKNTRRAILMIANPTQDNLATIQRLYGEGHKPKDIPCFVAGTRVFTLERGWTNIEDIVVGDRVLSFDNKSNMRYNEVTFSGETAKVNKLVKITLKTGESFTCTPEHKIYIRRKNKYEEIMAKDIVAGDYPLQCGLGLTNKGYYKCKLNVFENTSAGNMLPIHHIVTGKYGDPNTAVDHVNNNKLDNRPENLAYMTAIEHNRKSRLFDYQHDSSEHRKFISRKYPGITSGNYFATWTEEDVIQSYLDLFYRGVFDNGFTDNNGRYGVPSRTAIEGEYWELGGWTGLVETLKSRSDEFKEWYESRSPIEGRSWNCGERKGIKNWNEYRIESVEFLDVETTPVYDITVENDHNFVIDCGLGTIVHNCNREIHFYVTDNKLNCKVIQRSGDMIFGTGSINPFEFTFLQEIIYQRLLKLQGFEDLELGVYRWHVTNAHIYSNYYLQAEDVIKHFDDDKEHVEGTLPVAYPFTKEMFAHKLSSLNEIIACDNVEHLRALVNHYPFGKFNEIIELYYVLIKAYTLGKKIKELLPDQKLVLNISSIPDSLAAAIEGSAFKNFDINYDTESVSFQLVETK